MKGKIIKGIGGFYYVDTPSGVIYECRAKGIFRNQNIKPLVGDDVEIDIIDQDKMTGNVTNIFPRKNVLIRPPVANVDQAMILFAIVHPNPSYNLLDRFLIMMGQQKLPVIICFNKQDIATKQEQQMLSDAYEKCGYQVLFISVAKSRGIEALQEVLQGKTTVIAGPSGVGKSSLINLLHPQANMETGELSKKIARGKNTTRHSELFCINSMEGEHSTYMMDTPGFTSLYLKDVALQQLRDYYPEFEPFEPACRFTGCSHITEPDCAVIRALSENRIAKVRYDNYRVLYEELKNQKPVYGKKEKI